MNANELAEQIKNHKKELADMKMMQKLLTSRNRLLQVRITNDLMSRLETKAINENTTVSELTRQAVELFLIKDR